MSTRALSAGVDGAPTVVVLGAPRCGTTSLARYFRDVGMNVGVKDSFFLMDDDAGLRGPTHVDSHGAQGYLDLFEPSDSPSIEVSAGYLYQSKALEFFATWDVPPLFVVITRDPVERLQSVFQYFAGNLGVLPRESTFDQYIVDLERGDVPSADRTVSDAIDQGNYVKWISRWTAEFGHGSVKAIPFDDLSTKPADVVEQLINDAGGRPAISLSSYTFERRNESYVPRSELAARLIDALRKVAPTGAVRAWAGETLRRWQAGSTRSKSEVAPIADATIVRLATYYEAANDELWERFGVDSSQWIRP